MTSTAIIDNIAWRGAVWRGQAIRFGCLVLQTQPVEDIRTLFILSTALGWCVSAIKIALSYSRLAENSI